MKSEIGLWIDHRQAVIVVVTDAGEETNVVTELGPYDGFPFHAALSMGPYSVLIFSQ